MSDSSQDLRPTLLREPFMDTVARYRGRSVSHPSEGFVGCSDVAAEVRRRLFLLARNDRHTLITGATGTGKGLAASIIHEVSSRSDQPLQAVNCAAIPSELIESELFGHEKGSFTGAVNRHRGWFVRANGSTLFLDEIGEAGPELQAKLLRVLEDNVVVSVGGVTPQPIDVRVIAATNLDLEKAIREKKFRLDLYYRLYGMHIHIPPLVDRPEDIPELAAHLLTRIEKKDEREYTVTQPAAQALYEHTWPGNARELLAVLETATMLCEGEPITKEHVQFPPISAEPGT